MYIIPDIFLQTFLTLLNTTPGLSNNFQKSNTSQ